MVVLLARLRASSSKRAAPRAHPGRRDSPERAAPFAPIHKSFCKVNNCLRTCRLLVTFLRIFKLLEMPSALELVVDQPVATSRLLDAGPRAGCPDPCAGVRRAWSTR